MISRYLITIASSILIALALAGCGDEENTIIAGGGGSGSGGNGGGNGGGGNGGNGGTTPETNFFDIGGFLLNQNIHPLQDNIDPVSGSPDITPADPANCPSGTDDFGETVELFADDSFFPGGSNNPVFPVCIIQGTITQDVNLTNDHVYLIADAVFIGDGGVEDTPQPASPNHVLTIEPGTQLYGVADARSALRITRGSQIMADGTPDMPILFASVDTAGGSFAIQGDVMDLTDRGEWGGVILNGYARTNSTNDGGAVPNELSSEAAPASLSNRVFFGGADDNDNSGVLDYVIIGETGVVFQADAEAQSLTLEAVGDGTTITNVQTFGSEDDGAEWFGGTVTVENFIVNGADDDGIDFDDGNRSLVKNVIVRQGMGEGDHGIEADNAGPAQDTEEMVGAGPAGPVPTRPILANLTMLGWGDSESAGALLRRGFGGDIVNSAFADGNVVTTVSNSGAVFALGCFDNDDEVDMDLNAFGVALNCSPEFEADGDGLGADWAAGNSEAGNGTVTYDATVDTGLTVNGNTYVVNTSVSPSSSSDPSVALADDFIGAVNPSGTPFWQGWTVHIANE